MILLLLAGCIADNCFAYDVCEDGRPLMSCANEVTDACWYEVGDERFDCGEGCNCEAASVEALEECSPGDSG